MTLKVVVELNEAFQDLQGHLQELPSQIRSERLRTLALTGLHIEQGRMSAFVSRAPGLHLGEIKEYARVVVILNEAYPELLGVFTGISPRYRAARLRSLASIGLNALAASAVHAGGMVGVSMPISTSFAPAPATVQASLDSTTEFDRPAVPEAARQSIAEVDSVPVMRPESLPESSDTSGMTAPVLPRKPSSRLAKMARSLGK